jgi:predicted aldo/keto reductase-like oxidoreductase
MSGRFSPASYRKRASFEPSHNRHKLPRWTELGGSCPPVVRLGLATRGDTRLAADDVAFAVERGVNYLNWCGCDDGIARALRTKQIERKRVVVAMQLESRDASSAAREIEDSLRVLGTERIDVVTFYYVDRKSEWERIVAPNGALRAVDEARKRGRVGLIGLTTHQRKLAAECCLDNGLDLLMVRYNAAHRGVEQEVFPLTLRLGIPVVIFTAQRWGALSRSTPADPPGFVPPAPREWYRFALANPAVSVVLMAPKNRRELEEDLSLLDDWRPLTPIELEAMTTHGLRVRRHAGNFP